MLQWALQVQCAIELFCIKFKENENDLLSQGEWQDLRNMACILKNFADATLATEGYASSIDLTLQSMDFLLHVFETAKNDYAMDPFLARVKVEELWVNKYKALTVSAEIAEVEGDELAEHGPVELLMGKSTEGGQKAEDESIESHLKISDESIELGKNTLDEFLELCWSASDETIESGWNVLDEFVRVWMFDEGTDICRA
ncbi:hypothetical protein VC83_03966 [Pseudogymnoascus destructans]|uniref:Uncharacterized protein n=1 Tax=Pseudogymnoascus destructans TaxID=655981 RepID=A0A177AE34_9PEZI|nr:uncharacterized protein VC83_03966 [Pseudogymnoascus destructans]OAF59682.1 hypothetical protein VC83_03966 [Pseudogymnoascus destructans]